MGFATAVATRWLGRLPLDPFARRDEILCNKKNQATQKP